jgi:hypothetical protein
MENYSRGINKEDLKALRQELADLLEEDAKADKLRSLPLYSCKITGFKFVRSSLGSSLLVDLKKINHVYMVSGRVLVIIVTIVFCYVIIIIICIIKFITASIPMG